MIHIEKANANASAKATESEAYDYEDGGTDKYREKAKSKKERISEGDRDTVNRETGPSGKCEQCKDVKVNNDQDNEKQKREYE
jgi:hypothetical protein